MNKIKVAFIGAGYMAFEHAKTFASFQEFSLVGVTSRTMEKAHIFASQFNMGVFCTVEELYRITQADLVIVTVNELSMAAVCQSAFQYPWLCFLEKPVGYNYEQACEIKELAFHADHRPFVSLNRRSYSSTRYALEHLQQDPSHRLISVLDQQNIDAALEMGQPELVAYNFMYANSIHLIDYFNIFCRGDIVSVDTSIPWNKEKPEYVVATIKYSSGDIGLYQAVWNGPGPWGVSITTSNCRFEMRPLEVLKKQVKGSRVMQEIPIDPVDVSYKPGLHFQAEQVLQYFQGKKTTLACIDESLTSMRLCHMIYEN